jgi:CheY-like chemotaxis protein
MPGLSFGYMEQLAMHRSILVLIADDLSDDRYLLARALRKTGLPFVIYEVEDGAETIDFLSHQGRFADVAAYPRPDVLFLDLKMPVRTGFDVLRWIQQNPGFAPVTTIVVSGSELEADIQTARELNAPHYLTKPATPEQLRGLLCVTLKVAA